MVPTPIKNQGLGLYNRGYVMFTSVVVILPFLAITKTEEHYVSGWSISSVAEHALSIDGHTRARAQTAEEPFTFTIFLVKVADCGERLSVKMSRNPK